MSTRKKAIPVNQMTSIQDLQFQLKLINKKNQELREQLKKHDQGVMEESNQNLLRRSSVSSSASTSSIESRTSLNQPKPEVTSIQASSQLESRTSTVAKPQGSTAKNICKVLNLQKSDYQGYRGDLRDLIKAGSLELDKKWKDQDMKRILNLIKLFKQKNPNFPNCANDWAIKEMARGIINNKREYFRDKKNQVEAEKNNSEKQKEQDNEVQEEQDNEVHEEPDNEVLTNTNIIEEHSQYKENQEPFGDNSNQASNKKKGKKKLKRAIGSNLKDDHANKKQKNDQRRSRRLATSVGEEEECKYKGKPPVPPWMNDQEYQLFLEKRLKNESQQNPQED
ncbi:uncharacterized protein OCT59_014819 [Rhizophagus irregularis]|uniref:uncharacterized protein n=1 Tax=Rhizophagus irregularis TaxID=588596 RepID=UPI0019EA0A63|nr:hypothetical protein OCT59_014819 [Rhizophagus irregularis]GBC43958.2 hypothetical protein GLOIN_2v413141 [Rhizophagus irregularis DAOM 181602=DAOM 197198]